MRPPWTRRKFVKLLGAVTGVAALPATAVARIATQAEQEDPKLHPLVRVVLAIKARGGNHEMQVRALGGLSLTDDAEGVMALLAHPETGPYLKEEMVWLSGALVGPPTPEKDALRERLRIPRRS